MSDAAVDLYRSDTILVRRCAGADPRVWIVTFENFGAGTGFDRKGFGESFLRRQRISAIHLLGRGSDWYHYSDILAACAAVRGAIPLGARVMTYGSSMGGFAALRLAEPLGADAVLALSPQYSIDPAVVPWERRWYAESTRLVFRAELSGPVRPHGRAFVVYDPTEPDRRHAELIAADTGAALLPLRHAGHPVATFLSQTGLLRPLVLAARDGSLDVAAFLHRARAARRGSVRYLDELSRRQLPARPRAALALADLIAARDPAGEEATIARARALAGLGRSAEAITLFERVDLGARGRARDQLHHAEALLGDGRLDEAVAVARAVVARAPGEARLRDRLAAMLDGTGDLAAAVAAQEQAVALEPDDAVFASRLEAYRRRLPCDSIGEETVPLLSRLLRRLRHGTRR